MDVVLKIGDIIIDKAFDKKQSEISNRKKMNQTDSMTKFICTENQKIGQNSQPQLQIDTSINGMIMG